MHPIRLFLLFLRRARASGLGVLLVLSAFVIVSATEAFPIEAAREGKPEPYFTESLYDAIGLFAMAGNRFGFPRMLILRVDYLLAPIIAASAVFGAFARVLEEHAPLFLRRFRGHTVIGGLGRLGITVARHEHRRKHAFAAIELNDRAPQVIDAKSLGTGVVLVGDMTSAALLRQARAQHAKHVFLTANSDVANLDAAFNVRRLAKQEHVRTPPTIYVHVFDANLADSLGHHLRSRAADEADIVPFNSYRFAAKALLAILVRDGLLGSLRVAPGVSLVRTKWPAGDDAVREDLHERSRALTEDLRRLRAAFRVAAEVGEEPERFAIVGLGRLGRALARELLDHAGRGARFLVVERTDEKFRAQMETFAAEDRTRFQSHIGDATDRACIDAVEAFKPTAAIICTDHDLGNLRLALDLHVRGVRTVTRMFDLEASTEFAEGLKQRGIATTSLQRLFHAAIPILTHERRLLACVNLDVDAGHSPDHLFYLARVTSRERRALGTACVALEEVTRDDGAPDPPNDLALVWHRAIENLDPHPSEDA
jgi:Trk K+ transport system NAD-binding subunit